MVPYEKSKTLQCSRKIPSKSMSSDKFVNYSKNTIVPLQYLDKGISHFQTINHLPFSMKNSALLFVQFLFLFCPIDKNVCATKSRTK